MDYKKLFKDKAEGKNPPNMVIIFDNDGGYWTYSGDKELTDDEHEKKCYECEEKYGSPDGYCDVVDIMNAAGIKAEWC